MRGPSARIKGTLTSPKYNYFVVFFRYNAATKSWILPREDNGTFRDGVDGHVIDIEVPQIVEKFLFDVRRENPFQVSNVAVRVLEIVQEFDTFLQSGEDGELAVEGIFSKKQIENCEIIYFARFPIGISHGKLIQIYRNQKKMRIVVENLTWSH